MRAIPRVLRRARLLIGTAPKEQYIETKVEILVSPQLSSGMSIIDTLTKTDLPRLFAFTKIHEVPCSFLSLSLSLSLYFYDQSIPAQASGIFANVYELPYLFAASRQPF